MTELAPSPVVIDASALLAWLQREPGWDLVDPHLDGGVMCTVNWAEVIQKVLERAPEKALRLRAEIEALGVTMRPFTAQEAEIAAALHEPLRSRGLSLADRACLATGIGLDVPVLTGDRAWKDLSLPVPVLMIR